MFGRVRFQRPRDPEAVETLSLDYSTGNRTYRHFRGKPLYPFGYGLSSTTFRYRDLNLPQAAVNGRSGWS